MVAIRGPGWGLAPCLVDLVAECDELAPNRSTASDGSVGDTAHSARTSDHNPDDGWVCAVDITDDKAGGCDADLLARHIVASRDPRVKYVIWNATIAKSYASNGYRAWEPQPYTGANPHTSHTHVSVHNTAAARNDLTPWWPQNEPAPPAPPVAPAEEDEDMPSAIAYFKNPTSDATHAYVVNGLHAKWCVKDETTKLLKYLGVKELNTRAKAFGPEWQNASIIVDGPCKNVT